MSEFEADDCYDYGEFSDDCLFGNDCLMTDPLHLSSECVTAEMMAEHYAWEQHMDLLCTSRWYRFKYRMACLPSDVQHFWSDVKFQCNKRFGWFEHPDDIDDIPF